MPRIPHADPELEAIFQRLFAKRDAQPSRNREILAALDSGLGPKEAAEQLGLTRGVVAGVKFRRPKDIYPKEGNTQGTARRTGLSPDRVKLWKLAPALALMAGLGMGGEDAQPD